MQRAGEWILAVDVGMDAGYALRNARTQELVSGSLKYVRKPHHRPGRRFVQFEGCLESLNAQYPILKVVYEEPMGNFKNHHAALSTLGYVATLMAWCEKSNLDCKGYPQTTLKKHATGSGAAKKPDMLASAQAKWPEQQITTDDQADACWVLDLDATSSKTTTT